MLCYHVLMNLRELLTIDKLEKAFQKVCDNRGGAGIDGISAQSYIRDLRRKLQKLILEIMTNQYRASPCKVVGIPKSNGKIRQLSIPTIRDRIVHTAISQAFVPFFEKHFEICSYGYRPRRSYLQAVSKIEKYRDQGYDYVLDADISNYFNNIPQKLLKTELTRYVHCQDLVKLIFSSIKQMQYHRKVRLFGEADGLGVPQGSPLSPVLANMYLDPLDEALMAADYKIIRYADDFVVLCKSLKAAGKALELTKKILNKYQLTINADKTRVTDFESGFIFLGHFFIGNMVQKLASIDKQLHESSWKWDAPNTESENYKHAFTGKPVEQLSEPIDNENYAELQQQILDCNALNDSHAQAKINLNLSNKLRTLYLFKQGSVIHKIAGKIEVRHGGETLQQIPITQIDSIMCFGAIHITRAVMLESFQNELPIIFMSITGHWQGMLRPYIATNKTLQSRQLTTNEQPLPIAKIIIEAKLHNSITTIRRYLRYHQSDEKLANKQISTMTRLKKRVSSCQSLNSLRGLEGNCARIYFKVLQTIIPKEWNFKTRNRRPPQDPINAMLSLGYTLLFNNIYAFVMLREMIMEYGYVHAHYHKQPALALDMMEPFRSVVVDAVVLKLVKNNIINPIDFKYKDKACLLTTKAKKIFVTALEKQLSKALRYEALNIKTDYRRIMDLQILLLKQSLLNDKTMFEPFRLR